MNQMVQVLCGKCTGIGTITISVGGGRHVRAICPTCMGQQSVYVKNPWWYK